MLQPFPIVTVRANYIGTWWWNNAPRLEAVDGYLWQGYCFSLLHNANDKPCRYRSFDDSSESNIRRFEHLATGAVSPVYDFDGAKRAHEERVRDGVPLTVGMPRNWK
jgi:hypothetical protein